MLTEPFSQYNFSWLVSLICRAQWSGSNGEHIPEGTEEPRRRYAGREWQTQQWLGGSGGTMSFDAPRSIRCFLAGTIVATSRHWAVPGRSPNKTIPTKGSPTAGSISKRECRFDLPKAGHIGPATYWLIPARAAMGAVKGPDELDGTGKSNGNPLAAAARPRAPSASLCADPVDPAEKPQELPLPRRAPSVRGWRYALSWPLAPERQAQGRPGS
jgi:hypothetical protein